MAPERSSSVRKALLKSPRSTCSEALTNVFALSLKEATFSNSLSAFLGTCRNPPSAPSRDVYQHREATPYQVRHDGSEQIASKTTTFWTQRGPKSNPGNILPPAARRQVIAVASSIGRKLYLSCSWPTEGTPFVAILEGKVSTTAPRSPSRELETRRHSSYSQKKQCYQ